ncbi:MAG: methyltransferase domain-containing protein [Deltaproteobacteria bacterium]|nr:methyltransferase domain-containing protein [Deltaproteobacteria bacterium]
MLCEKYIKIKNSLNYSPHVRFLAFQSYLTSHPLLHQLNSIPYNFDNKIAADIGTGLGILPCLLKNRNAGKIIGIDSDKELLNAGSSLIEDKNVYFICADGFNMPIKDASFDAVFIRYVFQHVNLSDNFLIEVKRVMKDDGILVIIDIDDELNLFYPDLPERSENLFKIYSEYQKLKGGDRFISKKLPSFLSAHGFRDIKVKPYTATFFSKKDNDFNFAGLKDAFLLIQNELELVKNDLFKENLIGMAEFHKGLNDYFNFLNSKGYLFISKTEFVITGKK